MKLVPSTEVTQSGVRYISGDIVRDQREIDNELCQCTVPVFVN
jgi:hypothetical protein